MVFSYGFLEDKMKSAKDLFLDFDIPDDDPLKMAKMALSTAAPGFRLFAQGGGTGWEGDFVWLICVNEEDGLEIRQLQRIDGQQELEHAWKGHKIANTTILRQLLEEDEMWEVFKLRATSFLQNRVEMQLRELWNSEGLQKIQHGEGADVREQTWRLSIRLRALEQELLETAYGDFEDQVRYPFFPYFAMPSKTHKLMGMLRVYRN